MKLTEKETKAFAAIVKQALEQMCGNEPNDLLEDNCSWFNETDITAIGFSKHQAAGLMSSLAEKELIQNWEPDEKFGWVITDEGILLGQELFVTYGEK